MNILRANANYDIAAKDLSFIMDIGFTPQETSSEDSQTHG